MNDTFTYTFPALLSKSFENYRDAEVMGFVGKPMITYGGLKERIDATMAFFEKLGIQKGDKVALFSINMPNWGIGYLSITFMGAVVVPLLPDFHRQEVENILKHSGAKAILVSENLMSEISGIKTDSLEYIIKLEDFSLLHATDNHVAYDPESRVKKDYQVEEEDLAAIIYTSGTTGKSKGVMLTHKNISHNAQMGKILQPIFPDDRFLSILPLSHTLENTLGFFLPLISGAKIYYLEKLPTPSVLIPALEKVKPTIMLSVPIVMEKIYRNKILPSLTGSPFRKTIYKTTVGRKILNKLAGKKLMKTFGEELRFFGIGGSKLDRTVEQFLIEAGFPYAIGYGLTETAPLLAGAVPGKTKLQSTGPSIENVELKINNPDPDTGEGEIWAKGPNVMKAYYKEPELTSHVLTEDGWFKTGDLGILDRDNYLFIRGRLKNMIVGSSGENIYPEEIESVINNFNFVLESLVVEQKGKLVALVHFNRLELEKMYQHLKEELTLYVDQKIEDLKKELREYVNSRVNKFSRVQLVIVQAEPFQKTATQKIKRFLYTT